MKTLKTILDWSEVWAPFIPLAFLGGKKKLHTYLKPVRLYIWLALLINIFIIIIWKRNKLSLPEFPDFLQSNNFLYNVHSIVRFLLFAWFFTLLDQPFLRILKKIVPGIYIILVLFNFLYLEDFFYYWSFSNRLLSIETGILLLFCLQYYFYILKEEHEEDRRPPSFWVVTGLSIYVVINFPIFLFYKAFLKEFENFAIGIWDVTNLSFIIFCLFIAKAFYESKKQYGN